MIFRFYSMDLTPCISGFIKSNHTQYSEIGANLSVTQAFKDGEEHQLNNHCLGKRGFEQIGFKADTDKGDGDVINGKAQKIKQKNVNTYISGKIRDGNQDKTEYIHNGRSQFKNGIIGNRHETEHFIFCIENDMLVLEQRVHKPDMPSHSLGFQTLQVFRRLSITHGIRGVMDDIFIAS